MKRNQVSQTGLEISELSLGTVKFGRNTDVKYPTGFALPDKAALRRLLSTAAELGVNYLDTAPAYGDSEAIIGDLIKTDRDRWVVSTKVGEYYHDGQSEYRFDALSTRKSIDTSLTRLGVDELDIVFVHSNGDDARIIQSTEVLETLIDLQQAGKIRALGFSGKDVAGSKLALPHCDIFMVTLNQNDQSQTPLIEACQKEGKAVVIKKALASGHSVAPNQALKFVNQFPGVTSTIVGTLSEDHLRANAGAITDV